jgi:hypothetical protein
MKNKVCPIVTPSPLDAIACSINDVFLSYSSRLQVRRERKQRRRKERKQRRRALWC